MTQRASGHPKTTDLAGDLEHGFSLPASWYTDPAILELERILPALDARELEQVVDEHPEALRVAVDHLEVGAALLLGHHGRAAATWAPCRPTCRGSRSWSTSRTRAAPAAAGPCTRSARTRARCSTSSRPSCG